MLLRRYLQETVGLSRRQIFGLLQSGHITLNDVLVSDFSLEVVDGDRIVLTGAYPGNYRVVLTQQDKHLIAFHKPVGYVVSRADPHNHTIYDLLPPEFMQYRYVGRLDKDSRGLLLLSDDLDLVHQLSHPSHASEKVYVVVLNSPLLAQDMEKCLQGVFDDGDMLQATAIAMMDDCTVRVVLQEGKNRHIRRMFASIGYDVVDLCRISHGDYVLGDLEEGKYTIIDQ